MSLFPRSREQRKGCATLDVADLQELLQVRRSFAEIAGFLCREVDEVEDKIARQRS